MINNSFNRFFMGTKIILLGILSFTLTVPPTDTNGPSFSGFMPLQAPQPTRLLLRHGDRLAICGDSITEQKMYSRIMEDYLTMCVPELAVTVRQYGWSGERAPGFLARMTNDCLRFEPTIATTCYGMNDHEYTSYSDRIGDTYRTNMDADCSHVQKLGRARDPGFGRMRRQSSCRGTKSGSATVDAIECKSWHAAKYRRGIGELRKKSVLPMCFGT